MNFFTYMLYMIGILGALYWAGNSEWLFKRRAETAAQICREEGYKKAIVTKKGLGVEIQCAEKIPIKAVQKTLP